MRQWSEETLMNVAYSGFDQTLTYFWDQHNKGVSRKSMPPVVRNVLIW